MALTGDDGSDTESVPEELFQHSSSAVAVGEDEEVQYAQNPKDDSDGQSSGGDDDQPPVPHIPDPEDQIEDEDQQDYSDEDTDRENRFEGPASTWRFYTESERALAAFLDQERANDLGIHLYNAHALKAKVRDPEATAEVKHHQGKKQWMKANDDGTLPWQPDAHWTAWPMKPEDVPRKGEAFGVPIASREEEKATYRMPMPWKPSADLEEEIQAIMLRTAKERLERARTAQKTILPPRRAEESSPRKRKRSVSSDSSSTSSDNDANPTATHVDRHDSPTQIRSQDLNVLLDDEEAADILQPSIRDIVSKLDDLLLGLHKSRKGHVKALLSPRSQSRNERRRSRSRAEAQANSNDDEDVTSASEDSVKQDGRKLNTRTSRPTRNTISAEARSSGAAQDRDKQKRKPPLNPRDWSEVLGVASLVGWDPAVVQRTRERCSSLFREGMAFRELGQNNGVVDEGNSDESHDPIVSDDVEEVGFICPVETCPRFTDPWLLKKTWRWREHLKRSHKYSKAEIERVEKEMKRERHGGVLDVEGHGVDGDLAGDGD